MNETDEIKARLPIEQVVGSYIPLKKAGRIYKANCPFHGEKTPSFTVSPDRGIYKCFGCGEGGDIFDFVMKLDGLSFPEALELLAERAGVKLEERKPSSDNSHGPAMAASGKQRLFQLNAFTAKLWHTLLMQHPKTEMARTYLHERGLQDETIAAFEIGYAPLGNVTSGELRKAGYANQEVAQAGDPSKFQDRIVFPIADITGKVIGFTGRLLELPDDPKNGTNRGPKYWNTPETPLFVKSRALYALHLAKKAIQSEDLVILAEGQMDVTMLHQAGFTHTVASSGTALTKEQIQMLGRFTTNIAFAYDQDKAGIDATKRGVELVLAAELNPFVIVVPHGKDPADCLKTDPETWNDAYVNRVHAIEWLVKQVMSEDANLTPVRKKEIVQQLLPWLSKIKDEVEQSEWVRWLAVRLQTEAKNLQTALSRMTGTTTPSPETKKEENAAPAAKKEKNTHKGELGAALLLAFPTLLPNVKDQLPSLKLAGMTPFLEMILPILEEAEGPLTAFLKTRLDERQQKETSLFIQDLLQQYDEAAMDEVWALEEFMVLARRLRSEAKEDAKAKLASEIRLAQQMGDTQRLQQLFSELKNLI